MSNNIQVDKITGEVNALNKSLQTTTEILAKLITEQQTLSKEISGAKGLKDVNDKLNKTKTTQNQIEKEGNKLLNTRNTLIAKQASKLQPLTKAVVKQKEAIKEQNRLMREQARIDLGIKKRNGLFKSMTKSIIAAGVAMIGFRTVLNVFKNSLKTIANFEQAMSKVRAVTGALPKDFKALTDDAKRLGSATSKSATQVAALQLEFSKLGFSTTEILNATEATISLSVAAGSDLAESAVVAASTIRGFGLNASETQRIVDVMAKSFASSALDLEKFKVSMAAVAPIAKANGKDIEFVTARLSVLSDAGLDASTSGTSLRNMFLELSKRGLTWEQGLSKINTSTNKNVTALELFGKRGATAALILADNIDKAQGLEKAYDGAAGSAKEMADIMEDNLIGDTTKLSSAWEGFILGLNKGEGTITVVFRGLTQWLTKVVNMFNMANKSYQDLINEARDNTLKEYIKGDADEVQFLADKLGDYNRALDLTIKSLKDYNANWMTDEEHEVVESRIFALESLRKKQDEVVDSALEGDKEVTKSGVKRNKILIESELNYLQKRKALEDLIREQSEKFLGDKIESEDDMTNRLLSNLQKRVDSEFAAQQLITDREQKAAEERAQIRDEFINTSQELGNILFDLGQSQRERELEGVRSNYAAQIEAAEGNTELKEKLAKDLAREEARIQRQQAQSERNQALFNIAISTAQNIVKAGFNIPLIAFTTALGIAQTAAVLSQPLPEVPGFFKGTESAPAGLKWVAEQGSELINMPDGRSFLAKEKQLINTSGGEQILNHADTTRALNSAIYEDIAMNGNEGIESRLDALISTNKNLKQVNVNFDADGMDIRMQKGNSSIKYLNKKGSK